MKTQKITKNAIWISVWTMLANFKSLKCVSIKLKKKTNVAPFNDTSFNRKVSRSIVCLEQLSVYKVTDGFQVVKIVLQEHTKMGRVKQWNLWS